MIDQILAAQEAQKKAIAENVKLSDLENKKMEEQQGLLDTLISMRDRAVNLKKDMVAWEVKHT